MTRSRNPSRRRLLHLATRLVEDSRTGWIETLVITATGVVVASMASPDDPFLLHGGFPWLIFPPLFLALRHGFAFGFVSSLFLAALIIAAWRAGYAGVDELPASYLLGLLLLAMLAGEFSDLWQRRIGQMEIEGLWRDRRMEEFTRSYHLLKVSHDQLAEQLACSTVSIRQAMHAVREEMLANTREMDPLHAEGETILSLFRRYAAVQSASLYGISGGKLDPSPLARLGTVPEHPDHVHESALVQQAIRDQRMQSVLAGESGAPRYADGDILAAVPISDLTGRCRAMIVIYRIPFLKFNDENLSLIAVMASYLGDLLYELEQETPEHPAAGPTFERELERQIRYARQFATHAHVVAIELPDASNLADLLNQRRSLDVVWSCRNQDGNPVVLWLMPFTDPVGVAGFRARIELWAQKTWGVDEHGEIPLHFYTFPIHGDQSKATFLRNIRHACNLGPH